MEHINQEGIQLLKEVKNHWCFSFTERKQELLKTKTQFKNFERSNIDLPKLSETLSATHPQDIIDSHIAEITWFDWQQSQKIKFQKWKDLEFPNYSAEDLNLIKGLLNRPAGKIRLTELENFAWRKKGVHIYSTEKFLLKPQKALQDTISLINHEIFGHATDWAHSTLLNSFQRIDYLYRIAQRLEKGNNLYSSPQVEQRFKKINNYTRAEEYNAYICQVYYDTPEKLRKEHPEDFELVDNTVRILDPSFDVFGKTKK